MEDGDRLIVGQVDASFTPKESVNFSFAFLKKELGLELAALVYLLLNLEAKAVGATMVVLI